MQSSAIILHKFTPSIMIKLVVRIELILVEVLFVAEAIVIEKGLSIGEKGTGE